MPVSQSPTGFLTICAEDPSRSACFHTAERSKATTATIVPRSSSYAAITRPGVPRAFSPPAFAGGAFPPT